jgi:hypothetical protein
LSKKHRIDDSAKYKKFIKDRDTALEHIYKNYQVDISNELNTFLMWMTDLIRSRLSRVIHNNNSVFFIPHVLKDLDKEYDKKKPLVVSSITMTFAKMSQITKALSFAAQAEALARSTGNIKNIKLQTHKDNHLTNSFGQPIPGRIELALDRIKRRIWDKIQLSMVDGSDLTTTMDRVISAMPKQKRFKIQPRIKHLKEADVKVTRLGETDLLTGTITDEMWDAILDAYRRDEQIDRRGPEYLVSGKAGDEDAVYEWEVEQQAADEFYSSVMVGDKDAADQSGVDLIWIAVLDDRTGDSDAWRDGKLLSEIETTIDENGSDPFDNDFLMPPIHERCRCRVAPVTDEMPEARVIDNEDFDAWLNG